MLSGDESSVQIIRLLFRQPVNVWKELSVRVKTEVILLAGLVFAYLITRSHHLFYTWIVTAKLTATFAGSIIIQSIGTSFFLTAPLIISFLIPNQPHLKTFYGKPLEIKSLSLILFYYYQKYQISLILMALPIIIGLAIVNWLIAAACIIFMMLFNIMAFLVTLILKIRWSDKTHLTAMVWMLALLHGIAGAVLIGSGWFWLYQSTVLVVVGIYIWLALIRIKQPDLEIIFPPTHRKFRRITNPKISFRQIPRVLPSVMHALFSKELLGLWRNRAYRRLKIWTLVFYASLLAVFAFQPVPEKDKWLTILTGILVWLHYSHHFSEKYVLPEPAIFFHTLPVRFLQIWISKFLVEALYVMLVLGTYWAFLVFSGSTLTGC